MSEKNASKEFELEWIQLRKDLNMEVGETSREKFLRKFKSNPAVPIGCLVTAGVLSVGLYSFRTGNQKLSQLMMRSRVAAQGLTVIALVIGVALSVSGEKK